MVGQALMHGLAANGPQAAAGQQCMYALLSRWEEACTQGRSAAHLHDQAPGCGEVNVVVSEQPGASRRKVLNVIP